MAVSQYSIVEYFAEHEGYRCGYCKSTDTNYSHGLWAHSMTVQDYQDLIDRGWRRSGKYCYKPTMHLMCCPHYTIRCDAVQFKLSKSQKNVLKRMNKFLLFGYIKDSESACASSSDLMSKSEETFSDVVQTKALDAERKLSFKKVPDISNDKSVYPTIVAPIYNDKDIDIPSESYSEPLIKFTTVDKKDGKKLPKPGTGPDPAKPPCKKAKLLRLERRAEKLKQNFSEGNINETKVIMMKNQVKSLEDFLNESAVEDAVHKLEITLVHVSSNSDEFTNTIEESFLLYQKYQMNIHKETRDECDRDCYFNFLVKSPLELCVPPDGPRSGYGSFHQQYRLDGKLIAVGVVDILPHCVSSVYFYYDPDYSFLSLGTYASLREITFTRELQKHNPELHYYYMGFYIHSCAKMRYKGNYSPSYLLCPETYIWHPIENCLPKLDKAKYSRLESDKAKGDGNILQNVDEVLVLHRHKVMAYYDYRLRNPEKNDEAEVRQYSNFVGLKCAKRMLLYRS